MCHVTRMHVIHVNTCSLGNIDFDLLSTFMTARNPISPRNPHNLSTLIDFWAWLARRFGESRAQILGTRVARIGSRKIEHIDLFSAQARAAMADIYTLFYRFRLRARFSFNASAATAPHY